MRQGLLVVLEGVDGAGTTTQLQVVAERLANQGHKVHKTCEPSTGPVGRFLRQILTRALKDDQGRPLSFDWQTMTLLFAADRRDHLEREILPALERGEIVLCDRYLLSSLVYQSATSTDPVDAVAFVRSINQSAITPDLVCVFDVEPDVARQRRAARGGPAELFEQDDLQRRLGQLYAQAEFLDPNSPIVRVNAELGIAELSEVLVQLVVLKLESRRESPQDTPGVAQ
jgi:dTMP kinase